jgi:uncharacterized protein (TIGR02452 family)
MADLLDKTLQLTQDNWGTVTMLDFSGVTGEPAMPGSPVIEVTGEAVQDAALRFRGRRVAVLNFASGVSPGGGVRYGAKAQEEALCLCSGLLHGLEEWLPYYEKNRESDAPQECYDHMLWSEDVPLVRDGRFKMVDAMRINVITYPAPNMHRRVYAGAGQFSSKPLSVDWAQGVFDRRCQHVVRHAARVGTEVLILGAWGCGEYANDPGMVARKFKAAIETQSGGIERIVFAIYGVPANRAAFERVFPATGSEARRSAAGR